MGHRMGTARTKWRLIVLLIAGGLVVQADVAVAADTKALVAPFAAADWSVTDVVGRVHQPWTNAKTAAVVLVFISTDCPIANYYHPTLRAMQDDFSAQQVQWYFVQADPRLTAERAREHARDYELAAPVVLDPRHDLARATGATKTPQAAVITRDGSIAYLGRIDDIYTGYGKKRAQPTQRDLHDALIAITSGRRVAVSRTESVGCFIPFERDAGR